MSAVRTRFAPSPTGYMHLGGMRTALFNWAFARRHQGQFLLRIDDTDQARNQEQALGPILQAFRWLEMHWDEGPEVGGPYGPYFQSQRGELYKSACESLLEKRLAFYDFTPPAQTQAERQAAEKEKRNYLNNRNDLELSTEEVQRRVSAGEPHVIRFLVPRETSEKVVIDDLIRGWVEFDPTTMPDPVIMRADGTPLYNFATVVDDSLMQISHVIRAEEHLSNTPVQALVCDALGYERPQFAHIPYVAAPGTKEKLSKRKLEQYRKNPKFKKLFDLGDFVFPLLGLTGQAGLDPVMVEYYEKMGFLPDAFFNALARLGWSLDDQTEVMNRDQIVQNFSLERVVKSPAGFDPDKLMSFQAEWMNGESLEDKALNCLPYLAAAGYVNLRGTESERMHVVRVLQAVGERLVIYSDILRYEEFFVADDALAFEEKAFRKRILNAEQAPGLLKEFSATLSDCAATSPEDYDEVLHAFVEQQGIEIGQIVHALRVAITGKGAGVGLFDAMALLGTESILRRIDRTIEQARTWQD